MKYESECWAMKKADEYRQQKWECLDWCVERRFVMELWMACWEIRSRRYR